MESRFNGVFENCTIEKLADLFRIDFNIIPEGIQVKNGELSIETNEFEIYAYPNSRSALLMNGEYFGPLDELERYLHIFEKTLTASRIFYKMEYYLESEEGELVGEQIELCHTKDGT